MDTPKIDTKSPYELTTFSAGPSQPDTPISPLSRRSSMAALHAVDPQEGANIQELPPMDGGVRAWTFCAAAMVLEMMVWGFSFRLV